MGAELQQDIESTAAEASSGAAIAPGYADAVLVGGGAASLVYRATHAASGERVAIKCVVDDFGGRTPAEQVIDEAQATAGLLGYPGVLRPRLAVPDGATPFLVYDYIEAGSMREQHAGTAMAPADLLDFGIRLAAVVASFHSDGLVHGDLSPGNLYRTLQGQPLIGDFGTRAGATLRYAAPEVIGGRPDSPASDVWAMCASLVDLGDGVESNAVVTAELDPRGSRARPDVTVRRAAEGERAAALSAVLSKGFAVDPTLRPTALELVTEMRRVQLDSGFAVTQPNVVASVTLPEVKAPDPMSVWLQRLTVRIIAIALIITTLAVSAQHILLG